MFFEQTTGLYTSSLSQLLRKFSSCMVFDIFQEELQGTDNAVAWDGHKTRQVQGADAAPTLRMLLYLSQPLF